jgi:hypothetical protein
MKITPRWILFPMLITASWRLAAADDAFDAAPSALPLPEGNGLMWEDPREIHRVVVHFPEAAPAAEKVRFQYWGSRWPQQRLPKDREPGGGDVGWMELGNWYQHGWRAADAEVVKQDKSLTFTFRPINAKEFPKEKDYAAAFRYTLKIRVTSDAPLPKIDHFQVFTDSTIAPQSVRLAWANPPDQNLTAEAFNGRVVAVEKPSTKATRLVLDAAINTDPNTFDKTLVTIRNGPDRFTFLVNDLAQGPLFLQRFGVTVLPDGDVRDYTAIAAEQQASGKKTLYDRVAEMPEQTWRSAWEGVPRKKTDIYFPLGLDGGRQRFRLNADGSIGFRSNDHYLKGRPGKDTPRLELERGDGNLTFGLPGRPVFRTLEETSLPICVTTWDVAGVRITQTAFVTPLDGANEAGTTPPGDTFTVFLAQFTFTNTTSAAKEFKLPIQFNHSPLRVDAEGRLWAGDRLRGQIVGAGIPEETGAKLRWSWKLDPGASRSVILKFPYVVLLEAGEQEALTRLDFDRERQLVSGYWRHRLDQSARLITPDPMLNEFYRSHAMHLLVNCEREPGSDRRFARVGSFGYGAYGNESCMMVVDLDRRGYHAEAQNCLDAWLQYQGTVALPGSFESKDGVFYGAGGYEAGGYNQHHGWILWMMAEHYRFTRDDAWLRRAAPGIVKGADWIIRETARTADRHPLERGLLPAGSLEDIGDWWTWLSTSCYTWRGLDSAAGALEAIQHPDAQRVRAAARAYHAALLANFREASARSPVVRLRDGTAVPKIPSYVHRRGRSFGWICETLEGALHLLITGALDPKSEEAAWIVKDYEDNLFLSNQYGYLLDDFDRYWFGRGGMSMQACLLLNVEPYLYRDDVKHALRGLFNGLAVSYFPDVRMNTEHALPDMADWRGDHFKSSDESNAAGWLRYLFVREENPDTLLLGQAVPREWLRPGQRCGIERTSTHFGPVSIIYTGGSNTIAAQVSGPTRNPPKTIRLRFRHPTEKRLTAVSVNGQNWERFQGEWVELPGALGNATVSGSFQ